MVAHCSDIFADLGVPLLSTGQQPLAKFHQGVVVSRVRGMLLPKHCIELFMLRHKIEEIDILCFNESHL